MRAFILFLSFACGAFAAAPAPVEELNFRFAPSFSTGIGIRIMRFADGKIQFSSYSMPLHLDDKKPAPTLIKEGPVTKAEFEALGRMIEAADLRLAAESDDNVYLDGEAWIFAHTFGRRTLSLEFNSPPPSSAAHRLGEMFFKVAQVRRPLPK